VIATSSARTHVLVVPKASVKKVHQLARGLDATETADMAFIHIEAWA
jgi:hypothetical protein